MEVGMEFTVYDFVVIGILLFFLGRGIWVGFLRQITGLLALYLGYFAASKYHDRLFPFLREISANETVVFLITYFVLFIAAFLAVMLIGKILQYGIKVTFTQLFDRILGGMVGLAQGAIGVVILHLVLSTLLAPESQLIRKCATCSVVDDVADFTRQVISDPQLRESLKQQTPAISVEDMQKYLGQESSAESQSMQNQEDAAEADSSKPAE